MGLYEEFLDDKMVQEIGYEYEFYVDEDEVTAEEFFRMFITGELLETTEVKVVKRDMEVYDEKRNI